jgi:hypothetical protein
MRLDVPDNDIDAIGSCTLRGFEHGVRFADPRRIAEENLELSARSSVLRRLHAGQQFVGIRAILGHIDN